MQKIKKYLNKRSLKAHWIIGQSLTKKPQTESAVISDLFVWRAGKNYQTFFELLDMPTLFGEQDKHFVDIVFFNQAGDEIHTSQVDLLGLNRQKIDISNMVKSLNLDDELGTFAIFHSKTPSAVIQGDSFITERGYVAYQYENTPLLNYVHGNYDAIAKTDKNLELLGGSGILARQYSLQFVFLPDSRYELAMVNTCKSAKKLTFKTISALSGKLIDKQTVVIQPRALFVFSTDNVIEPSQVEISSTMVMARPVVFAYNNNKLDVFHG